jgi:hypothetical protein
MSDGWSFGGSILTFVFPMLLFFGVAASLYVLFTKPAAVPGRRSSSAVEHPVSYTPIAGIRPEPEVPGNREPGPDNPSAYDDATAADGTAAYDGTPAAGGEDAAPEPEE